MADISYSNTQNPSFIRTCLNGLGAFVFMITESNWRVREAERLQALSDAQLAQRGLRREDIARHVFRDLMHI